MQEVICCQELHTTRADPFPMVEPESKMLQVVQLVEQQVKEVVPENTLE